MALDKKRDVYMVIGGNGFVGRHIVQQLLARGDIVSVFDIVERYKDVAFYGGDLTEQEQVSAALRKSGTTCIIHTASPHAAANDPPLFHKVNVEGTKAIIAAAVECKVRKLVFTSSAGVVFNGVDLHGVDERLPYPDVPLDAYNETKALAEAAVLEANGKNGLLTCALRPAGIFGEGDRQAMAGFYQVYSDGKTHYQIGDNTNLFDWTYVGNVAKAHLLAADRLDDPPPAPPLSALGTLPATPDDVPDLSPEEVALLEKPILPINLSTGQHRIPTCEGRPLGPYVTPPRNAEAIEAAFHDPNTVSNRPIVKNRFDQLSDYAIKRAKLRYPDVNPLQVAGQAFFITNGEPTYFWDFPRKLYYEFDKYFPSQRKPRNVFALSRSLGLAAASGAEVYGYLTGTAVNFTRFRVTFSCTNRWYNIEKARRVLGYEPDIGLDEAAVRTAKWWCEEFLPSQKKSA